MSQEIVLHGTLMWQSSDLLVALQALLDEDTDARMKSSHGIAAMLQRIGTPCILPPDLQTAMPAPSD